MKQMMRFAFGVACLTAVSFPALASEQDAACEKWVVSYLASVEAGAAKGPTTKEVEKLMAEKKNMCEVKTAIEAAGGAAK
jgi:ethanolamine utilization microcompartment shell protein EutL